MRVLQLSSLISKHSFVVTKILIIHFIKPTIYQVKRVLYQHEHLLGASYAYFGLAILTGGLIICSL